MSDSITLCIVKDGAAGTSINMKTGVSSPDALPSSGASVGDSYIIDGHLWTYTGGTASDATHRNGFTDCGKVSGEAGKNNYVHVAWSNKQNPTKDDIVLSNTDGNAYAYMGTWVSETKEDTADEAVNMAKWVYVKGDKGDTPTFAKLRVNHSALHYNPSTGKWDYDSVTVTIVIFTSKGTQIPDYGDTKEYYWLLDDDTTVKRSSGMGFSATLNAASHRATLYKDGSNVAIDTITVPMVRDGKQGTDGIGALEISVAPDTLVFDTNDNGIVPNGTSKTATIACYRDGKKVTNVGYALTEDGHPDCSASISTSNSTATVTISNIATDKTYGVSKTCGTVEVQVYDIDNGRYYFPTVKFSVNVAKFNGGLKADNKSLESKYKELTNDGSITDLKEYRSEILQSAREISLHVSEKRAGRRNLLPGSAFRKQGEGPFVNNTLNLISVNGGYDGTNCIRATNTYPGSGDGRYIGAFWDGSQGASSIKIERGKKYTISVWAKCDNVNAEIALETIFTDKLTSAKRMGKRSKSTTWVFKVSKAGEWQLLQCTIDTSLFSDGTANTLYDCLAVNVFCHHQLTDAGGNGLTVNACFCRPMLEEGDEYNGWTLSEQDYDYVGGNLLDGTGTLTKTGNVEVLNPDNVTQGGMGESASIKAELPPTVKEVDFLKYSTSGMGLKANEDYVLSFYAKTEGNAGKLQCYLYPSEGDINTEDSDGGYDNTWNPKDGDLRYGIVVGTTWKRYWVHWRPTKADPEHVLFRLMRGGNDRGTYSSYTTYAVDDVVLYDGTYYRCIMAGQGNTPSSSSSYWDAAKYQISLSQPKLEVGATMTEWTAKRSDMVDKRALYATGIDIDSKKITLTASNTTFRDNDGKEMAVIDHDGLRATKIATTDNGGGHTEISGNTTVWYNKDGVTPGIKVFYDAAGVPHFQFCNSNGKVMYDFGPSGLQSFISSTQQAYSDECYLRSVSGGFKWVYVPKNVDADKRFVWRKQIPTTEASSHYEIYDGCVFTKEYYNTANSVNWPKPAFLLPDGWYVEPNDGNLPIKKRPADEEGVFDPTKTVYYQTFCYYSGGKVSRTVRAYMTRNSNTSDPYNRFSYNGSYDEML